MADVSRREFVKLGVLSSCGLLIGLPCRVRAGTSGKAVALQPLIRVGSDGAITLFAQNPEMGQGVKTALPMIIAEELDVDWSAVTVEQSAWDRRLENQFSGGSLSIRLNFSAMRQAGASARQMLLRAAAERWQLPVSELSTDKGFVLHSGTARKLAYAELAAAAAEFPVPEDPPLKPVANFNLTGHGVSVNHRYRPLHRRSATPYLRQPANAFANSR